MPDVTKLNAVIDAYAAQAYGSEQDDELSRERALALDAFAGKNIEPAPTGRSQVVDWTVFETVQWILPSLTRIFAGGDNIVEFEPTGPEDEDAAEQESEYLNYLVTQRNNWFLTVLTWCQDALLTKNAYCLAYIDERMHTEVERYDGQSIEQVQMLLEGDGVEIVGQEAIEGEPQEVQDPMTGEVFLQPTFTYNIEIRRTKPTKKLQFRVLPPERCLIDETTPDFTLECCDYFEFWENETLSTLRAMGYDVDDDIADAGEDGIYSDTQEDVARDEIFNRYMDRDLPDPSLRSVRFRNIWMRYDYDEDGIAELLHVVRVGREILEIETVSTIPVASIVPYIHTHRHVGGSVADAVFDIQRIKTAILRAGLDSLYLSLNPRHAVTTQVNLDDLLNSAPGAVVRVDSGAVDGQIMPLMTEFVFPQAQEGLRHMDTVVESRVGVNRMFQGIDESMVNDHNRIGQLSSMAAQRVEQIARIFGNGFERLFKIAHELILKSGHQAETVRLRGQWVQIDPSQWRTGRDMRVVAPYAAGNKDALLQRLLFISQQQDKAIATGLPVVTPDDVYQLNVDIAGASDAPGDRYFTDPQMIPPPEPPPDYTAMALEIEKQKADDEAVDEERKAQLDKYKAELDAELEKYKADLDAQVKVTLEQLRAGQSVNLENVRSQLKAKEPKPDIKGATKELKAASQQMGKETSKALEKAVNNLSQAVEAMTAEKEIIRDKDGKIVGARVKK